MNKMKAGLLSLLAILLATATFAQDKIYKRDNDVLNVKVKLVGEKTITYKRTDMPDGPDYTINKADVVRIEYSNGVEDVFSRHGGMRSEQPETNTSKRERVKYGRSLIAATPFGATDRGVSFGLSFEQSLDKKGIISVVIPYMYSFSVNNQYDYSTGSYNDQTQYMHYFYPGIKIYPTGAFGIVRYGVGPNLVIGTGMQYEDRYSSNYRLVSRTNFGLMVTNSLNINPSKHLYVGLELGLGITYIDKLDGHSNGTQPLVQTGFKMGYRF